MSGSSVNDHNDCQAQRLLTLLIHIAHQRRQHQRIWLAWSPRGWQTIGEQEKAAPTDCAAILT